MINWTVGILLALFLGSLFVVEHLIHRKRWRSLSHPQDEVLGGIRPPPRTPLSFDGPSNVDEITAGALDSAIMTAEAERIITLKNAGRNLEPRMSRRAILLDSNAQFVEERFFDGNDLPRVLIVGAGFVEVVYVVEESRFIGEARYHEAPTLHLDCQRQENPMG